MTLKEAAEFYNEICNKIKTVQKTVKSVFERKQHNMNPFDYYELNKEEMNIITDALTDYIKILQNKLNEHFEEN